MLGFQSSNPSSKGLVAWSEKKYKSQRQQLRSQSINEKFSENRRRFLNDSEIQFPTCPYKIHYFMEGIVDMQPRKQNDPAEPPVENQFIPNSSFSFLHPTKTIEDDLESKGSTIDEQSDSPAFKCPPPKILDRRAKTPRYIGRSKSLTRDDQIIKNLNGFPREIGDIENEDSMILENVRKNTKNNDEKAREIKHKQEPRSSYVEVGEYEYDAKIVLGQGSFGKVFWGRHKICKYIEVAVKEILITSSNMKFFEEIFITKSIISENVVQLYDSLIFSQASKCYLILELCNQGSLEDFPNKYLSTHLAIDYFKQIIKGMRTLNKMNIIHRDLKRANILLKNKVVKISDFGFAKQMGQLLEVNSLRCGTPATMAPEIYFNQTTQAIYNKKCDIWSLGVILHQMIYEIHPFETQEHFEKGRRAKIKKSVPIVDDFINKALIFDVEKRMNWEEVFQHPINRFSEPQVIKELMPSFEKHDDDKPSTQTGKKQPWFAFLRKFLYN